MKGGAELQLPVWSPRMSKSKMGRLYATFGQGVVDEELIDEVGFSLLARCESVLAATEAGKGRTACPSCASIVKHVPWQDEMLECRSCGWSCAWQAYRKTFQYEHPFAGGMNPFLDSLSYGKNIPEEVLTTRARWREEWRSSRWNSSKPRSPLGPPSEARMRYSASHTPGMRRNP